MEKMVVFDLLRNWGRGCGFAKVEKAKTKVSVKKPEMYMIVCFTAPPLISFEKGRSEFDISLCVSQKKIRARYERDIPCALCGSVFSKKIFRWSRGVRRLF